MSGGFLSFLQSLGDKTKDFVKEYAHDISEFTSTIQEESSHIIDGLVSKNDRVSYGDESLYTTELPANCNFKCDIESKTEEISQILSKNKEVRILHERLVPETVSYGDFWIRFFYARDVVSDDDRKAPEKNVKKRREMEASFDFIEEDKEILEWGEDEVEESSKQENEENKVSEEKLDEEAVNDKVVNESEAHEEHENDKVFDESEAHEEHGNDDVFDESEAHEEHGNDEVFDESEAHEEHENDEVFDESSNNEKGTSDSDMKDHERQEQDIEEENFEWGEVDEDVITESGEQENEKSEDNTKASHSTLEDSSIVAALENIPIPITDSIVDESSSEEQTKFLSSQSVQTDLTMDRLNQMEKELEELRSQEHRKVDVDVESDDWGWE